MSETEVDGEREYKSEAIRRVLPDPGGPTTATWSDCVITSSIGDVRAKAVTAVSLMDSDTQLASSELGSITQ